MPLLLGVTEAVYENVPQFPNVHDEGSYNLPKEVKQLREQGPVHRVQLFDGTLAWLVTRHKEVCEALNSDKLSNERFTRSGYPEIHAGGKKPAQKPTFVHMEGPGHVRQRLMVEDLFTQKAVEALRPRVERVMASLLDRVIAKGCRDSPVDLVQEFASLVNPHVVFLLFGIPEEEADKVAVASAAVRGTSGTAGEFDTVDLHQYLSNLVDQRIKNPGRPEDDLISKLVVEQYQKGNMTKGDIDRLAFMIFIAGNAAIANTITLGTLTLLQHPVQLRAIRHNPTLIKPAVEEILRYHTPSALNSRRVATADLVLGGKLIKAGEGVICAVKSANRDPEVFPYPDEFNIFRDFDPIQSLAFGFGPHRCQAQWISKVALESAIGALIHGLPNLRVAVPENELQYSPPTQNIGLMQFPVYF